MRIWCVFKYYFSRYVRSENIIAQSYARLRSGSKMARAEEKVPSGQRKFAVSLVTFL